MRHPHCQQAARVAERLAIVHEPPAAPAASASRLGGRLAEIAGYAGGALLLGAAALFLGSGWQDSRSAADWPSSPRSCRSSPPTRTCWATR